MRGPSLSIFLAILAPAVGLVGLWPVGLAGQAQVPDDSRVRAMGFGDFNYVVTELDQKEGFRMGQMVGHVIADLDDQFAFFGEVSLTGKDNGYSIEVERALVRYDFADEFKIAVGRFHTPIGYWNAAFHHGSWLQTSVARPEMVRFGTPFIPTHFVGVIAEGRLPGSSLGLGYKVGIGNGRAGNIARAGDAGDINDHRAWLARVQSRPISIVGLEIGATFYSDQLQTPAPDLTDTRERIYSVHAVLDRDAPEILAEYAYVTHDPVTGSGGFPGSHGYYVQFGYRLSGAFSSVKPYARVEQVIVRSGDDIFAPLNLNYDGVVAGIRYDAGVFLALRLEYRREQFEGLPEATNSLYTQASFVLSGF